MTRAASLRTVPGSAAEASLRPAAATTPTGPASPVTLRKTWMTDFPTSRMAALAASSGAPEAPRVLPFRIKHRTAPGVLPDGEQLAMDSGTLEVANWATDYYGQGGYAFSEGLEFLGYPYLAQLAQRPEYRRVVEVTATEMTRKWIRITVGNKDEQTTNAETQDKTGALEEFLEKIEARDAFRKIVEQDGYYGRAHLYLDLGDGEAATSDETMTPIGDGLSELSASKVNKDHPLRRLGTVEAVWTYPTEYNSNAPWRADWYRPAMWYAMGKRFHVSRLMCFVGREVPDLLKPAYSFGGLALTQMIKPYVDNWLQIRQSVNDIASAYSQMVLKTDMSQLLAPQGEERLYRRIQFFNNMRNNRGVMVLDKDEEDFANVSATLSGLSDLQSQAQEHMASVSGIPVVKLLGIQPSGLNASSEGELRSFYDWIAAYQNAFIRPRLLRVLRFSQLSVFGRVDPSINFEFNPLYALDEKQQAEVDYQQAQTDAILIDSGQILAEEARTATIRRPGSRYGDLEPKDVPDLLEEEEEGLEPEGGRPQPQAQVGEQEQGVAPPAKAQDAAYDDAEWQESKHPRAPDGKFGHGGSNGVTSISDLRKLSDVRLPKDTSKYHYFYHAVRHASDIDSILKTGLNANSAGDVYLSKDEIRDRGNGFVIVRVPAGKAREGKDVVESGLTYREFKVASVPPENVVRSVRAVSIGGGHTIREDRLAAYAADHQGLENKDIEDLPKQYRSWFHIAEEARVA